MRKCISIGIFIFAGLLWYPPLFAATYDLTGNWQCTFSGPWAEGDIGCLTGPDPSSTCTIEQTGDSFSLVLNTTCNPAFTCTFNGTVYDTLYTGSNSGPLDGGGTVTNTLIFTASSNAEASGTGNSIASFPEWECRWGFSSVTLSRATNPDLYSLTVNISGSGNVSLEPNGRVYSSGTLVTLTATPEKGWRFDSWAGDLEGSQNPAEILMDEDKTVSTVFTRLEGWITGVLHLLFGN
jgi:hypothetical protein